tara:strand:+ start:1905 stop:2177 length:273 start_codon:yes stop_codon:yes gene_type:complete
MINWIVTDWKYNRFRLICETLGSICFISIYVLMAWYGDAVSVFAIFLIQIAGSSLHIVNAYMRNSANILMLNVIVIVIAVFGIGKMFLGE